MYKVFSENNEIIFEQGKKDDPITSNVRIVNFENISLLLSEIMLLELSDSYDKLVVLSKESIEKIYPEFVSQYLWIEAAGGLVLNTDNQLLMIFRNQKWDLPKGKIELGESPEKAAIREVEEETGINDIIIINEVPSSYHIFKQNNKSYFKKTYWYEMKTTYEGACKP